MLIKDVGMLFDVEGADDCVGERMFGKDVSEDER